MDLNVVNIAISTVIAVGGWVIGHYFNSRRDAAANRKKMVTSYLVDAYEKLNAFACACAVHTEGSQSLAEGVNSAVADVQLFGTPKQIQLAKSIVKHFSGESRISGGNPLTDLLVDLRNTLRTELRLDAINEPIFFSVMKFSTNEVKLSNPTLNSDAPPSGGAPVS